MSSGASRLGWRPLRRRHSAEAAGLPLKPTATTERPADGEPLSAADLLIAELAAAEAERIRDSRFGGLHSRFGTRNGGVILAVVGGLVLLATGIVGLTLLGLLL